MLKIYHDLHKCAPCSVHALIFWLRMISLPSSTRARCVYSEHFRVYRAQCMCTEIARS